MEVNESPGAHTAMHVAYGSQHVERSLQDAPVEQRQVQHWSHPPRLLLFEEITGVKPVVLLLWGDAED